MLCVFAFADSFEQNSYFPLTKGSFWVYKLSNNVQLRFDAVGIEEKDGKQYFVITSHPSQDYENIQKEYYFPDEDGIYYYGKQLKNLNAIYIPLFKELPMSLGSLKTWEWKGTVSNVKTHISVTSSGPEDYKFGNTVLKTYKITQVVKEESQTDPGKKIVITKWYAKNIGKVKETNEIFYGKDSYCLTAELESFNIK